MVPPHASAVIAVVVAVVVVFFAAGGGGSTPVERHHSGALHVANPSKRVVADTRTDAGTRCRSGRGSSRESVATATVRGGRSAERTETKSPRAAVRACTRGGDDSGCGGGRAGAAVGTISPGRRVDARLRLRSGGGSGCSGAGARGGRGHIAVPGDPACARAGLDDCSHKTGERTGL
jgi:hypothetical protein